MNSYKYHLHVVIILLLFFFDSVVYIELSIILTSPPLSEIVSYEKFVMVQTNAILFTVIS